MEGGLVSPQAPFPFTSFSFFFFVFILNNPISQKKKFRLVD